MQHREMFSVRSLRTARDGPRRAAGWFFPAVILACCGVAPSPLPAEIADEQLATREFEFVYSASIVGLARGQTARVWIPVARSDDHQTVTELDASFPVAPRQTSDARYGNAMLYFEFEAPATGEISFSSRYLIERREVRGREVKDGSVALDQQREQYLQPNAKVPVAGRPLDLLRGLELPADPLALARRLYDVVDDHVAYDKSRPGYGHGDSVWVCDSRFGNCTDFHSLFISLARGRGLPARFEIGFPLPPERGEGSVAGYHCWAYFHTDDRGWTPVDISEADKHPDQREYYFGNLTEDRVAFSTGRDIVLEPRQAGPPLNYFVYPHVEVGGREWPRDQVKLRFSYLDK